jgi:YD repeat-containing protein
VIRGHQSRSFQLFAFLAAFVGTVFSLAPVFAQATPSAYMTGWRWDVLRRMVGQISAPVDPAAPATGPYQATRFTYDVDGQLIRIEKGTLAAWQADSVQPAAWVGFTALETVTIAYDAAGNKIDERLTSAAGGAAVQTVNQTGYDGDDRPICATVRMNMAPAPAPTADACVAGTAGSDGPDRITRTVYDAASQVVQVRKAVGTGDEQAYATYTYSDNGKRRFVIDGKGNKARLDYDGFDRQSAWLFPQKTGPPAFDPATVATVLATAGSESGSDYEQYQYDANGNRTWLRHRDGNAITNVYDALNRISQKSGPAITTVAYGYDLVGHQLSATYGAGGPGVANGYDKADRLISSSSNGTGGTVRTLGYSYDANGNRTGISHPDSSGFVYRYDGLNRATKIEEGGGTVLIALGYDALGRRATMARGGAVASGDCSAAVTTRYCYDPASRLASLVQAYTDAGSNLTSDYGWTPASQIRTRSRSNDAAYAFGESYNGTRNYTANGLNQYSQIAGPTLQTPSYDANGNVANNGWTAYAYDGENRLTKASGSKTASLSYDPLGRLYEVTSPNGTTRFVYDGDALVGEYDGRATSRRATSTAPGSTSLWSGMTGRRSQRRRGAICRPIIRARSSRLPMRAARWWRSIAMIRGAYRRRPMSGGSNIPGRSGCPSSGSTITRHGSIRRRPGGSCRPIRWGTTIRSISMLMSGMIQSGGGIQRADSSRR